jgi:alpha-L-rhamnosidase
MKAWVEYIRTRATDGLLWNNDYQLGDWVALDAKEGSYFGATATDLIATAYYAKCADILSQTADLLGHEEDATFYSALWNRIKNAYADEFFSPAGRLVSPTQTAHILSLAFDMTPENYKARTIQGLLKLLEENEGHLTTGFLGTPYFCQVLADNGCLEDAYKLLLKEDYPSWLYQITKGATTVWEHWDGIKPDGSMWDANMNSFNHYAYGSVGEFLYRVIAGIDTDLIRTGYKHIIMRPRPGGGITHAKASVVTPYGRAAVSWRTDDGKFKLAATVPHNSTTAITLPDHATYQVGSGNYEFSCEMMQANNESD